MTSPHPAAGTPAAPAPVLGSSPIGSTPVGGPTGGPAAAPGAGYDPYPASGAPVTPRARHDRDVAAGARPVTDPSRNRRTPLAWLPWAALAALLLLLAASVLTATLLGRDDDGAASTTADRGTASGTGARSGAQSGAGGAGQAGAAPGAGTLTAGDTDVLADGQVGDVASLAGQDAVGRGVLVESVVADEGFWVGRGPEQRVFVFLTEQARRSAGESGYQVEAGQRIDLNGSVEGLGSGAPAAFGVTEQEGATQLAEQGAYVSATQVRLSAS